MKPLPSMERFLNRFTINEATGCWEWKSGFDKNGYGILRIRKDSVAYWWKAHRLSVRLFTGSLDDNLLVCHKCHNARCVNPEHLYQGTTYNNAQDRVLRGTQHIQSSPGELNPNARLKEEDVRQIRASCLTERELSFLYGISATHVGRIRRRKMWRNVS